MYICVCVFIFACMYVHHTRMTCVPTRYPNPNALSHLTLDPSITTSMRNVRAYEYWHYVLPPDQDQGYTQDAFIASNPVCVCLAQSQAGPMTFDHMRHPEDIQTIETGYPVRYWME